MIALPQVLPADLPWPDQTIRVAVSSLSVLGDGTASSFALDREVKAVVTLGINSGVEISPIPGAKFVPVYHAAVYMGMQDCFLRKSVAAADGTVILAGFTCAADGFLFAEMMKSVPPQQGAASSVGMLPEYGRQYAQRITNDGAAHDYAPTVALASPLYTVVRPNVGTAGLYVASDSATVAVATTRFFIPAGISVLMPMKTTAKFGYLGTNTETFDTIDLGN